MVRKIGTSIRHSYAAIVVIAVEHDVRSLLISLFMMREVAYPGLPEFLLT